MRLAVLALVLTLAPGAGAEPRWMTLPPTPRLPRPARSGHVAVGRVRIWYAEFGRGAPVILLHGGLANANYWGGQVPALARHYRVVVMDTRGHGRSTRDAEPFGYDRLAVDVLALMDRLGIAKAAVVGWSDGAIVGLDLAIHHPERVACLFAFAANSDPSGVADVAASPVFGAFVARAAKEYRRLSPTPKAFASLRDDVSAMWAREPHFTAEDLAAIRVPVWIADGDHDEAIRRENTEFMAAQIPGAGLLIEPEVSHFAMLQDPQQFTADVLRFLARGDCIGGRVLPTVGCHTTSGPEAPCRKTHPAPPHARSATSSRPR